MIDALRSAWLAARETWPGVDVAEEEFSAYVAERMDSAKGAEAHAALRTIDLYLACACQRGDEAALRAFERAFFEEIPRAMKRTKSPLPPPDEVAQMLRHKLFVAAPGDRPKIADYRGRGSLRTWFRVTVARVILNLLTRPSPEIPFEEDLLASLLAVAAPDLEAAKEAYRRAFREAFPRAFAGLDERERALLRYAFGQRLTVEAIGAIYGVHKTSAARWVVRAHKRLLDGVRADVMERLGIGEDEYFSVLRLVQSQLELSLERYLGAPAEK